MLYDLDSARIALGCLMTSPSLLKTDKVNFIREDFKPNRFHLIMFSIIENLANQGANEIDEVMIDMYVQPYEAQKEILMENNFMEFVPVAKKLAIAENTEVYFKNLRKYTCLRKYQDIGFDISEIYDETKSELTQRENLDKYEVDDIINFFEAKHLNVKKVCSLVKKNEEKQAGIGFEKIKEMFKESPYFGAMLPSAYLSTLCRGFCIGHFNLGSAGSGVGKTVSGVYELVYLSATELWDENEGRFVVNKNRQGSSLFINTELDLTTEIEPMFVGAISGVDRGKILDGIYDEGEEARVDRAIEILKESGIYLVDMPDFTMTKIELCIKEHKLNFDIKYVLFDYIADNNIVGKEMSNGTVLRGDLVLLHMAEGLKTMAKRYEVGIKSSTQLNGQEKTVEIINEQCLAGSKAIKNKCDNAYIMMPLRKKEEEIAEQLISRRGFSNQYHPNVIFHVFKSRFSKHGEGIKIWAYIDKGTGRIYDLATTDNYNNPIKIEKSILE